MKSHDAESGAAKKRKQSPDAASEMKRDDEESEMKSVDGGHNVESGRKPSPAPESATKIDDEDHDAESGAKKIKKKKTIRESDSSEFDSDEYDSDDEGNCDSGGERFHSPAHLSHLITIRTRLMEEGLISDRTFQCLKQMKRNVMVLKNGKLHYDDYEHIRVEYYVGWFNRTKELFSLIEKTQTLYKEPDWSNSEMIPKFLNQLQDITNEVVGPAILSKVEQMLQAARNGDMEGFKSGFDQVKAYTKSLKNRLTGYFMYISRLSLVHRLPFKEEKYLAQLMVERETDWEGKPFEEKEAVRISSGSIDEYIAPALAKIKSEIKAFSAKEEEDRGL